MLAEEIFPLLEEDQEPKRLRVGVLISGSGTNLQALLDACASGALNAEIAVVVSNKPDAFGLVRARRAGVPAVVVDRARYESVSGYNAAIADVLKEHGVELVVMAGYMRLLGKEVLSAFPNRVMNLHPSLLPAFAGASGIKDAYEYGVKVTGVTVHFADEHLDHGPIICQEPVRVDEDDTLETLEAKIHEVEHRLIVEAVRLFEQGRLLIEGRRVRVLPAPDDAGTLTGLDSV
ncbi:folate-dependent phosphoribosylglycinamide formyltransferase PurN [Coriobacteriaceae bacterium EMTCatB1]|nr:folate-dependent phosphoribosylglycinamide formyltransferase PurN [Coriobacteriaceae bacterium EMTCatB1]